MSESKHLGKYEIIENIGHGGFATVYRARDTKLDRLVALKVLDPYWSRDQSFVTRFHQEARTAARLRHPNIVTVHDAGEVNGQLYIAMEYLPGCTLQELLKTEGALGLEQALPILDQLARALDYAHRQSVVHRDVKPSNVMVEETADGIQVTLMDFGLVKALSESTVLTSQGTLLGSPEYMAPEQADSSRKDEIGPATDRYALGVVAYHMLTGQVPFSGPTTAVLHDHVYKPPPDPQSLQGEISEEVAQVLLKALAKKPEDRYRSGEDMVKTLRERVLIFPSLGQALPWRWIGGIGAGLMVLALLVWGLSGGLGMIGRLARTTPTTIVATTVTATPAPEAGATRIRGKDDAVMVYVPAGEFWMGSDDDDPDARDDEKPQHKVYVDTFWIDQTEVTNAQYKKCVDAGACSSPPDSGSKTRSSYYGNPEYDDYPVVYVDWYQAQEYTEWVGGRLCTEAEWEYAARGPEGLIYPWGNDFDGTRLNFCDSNCPFDWKDKAWDDGYTDTAPVGSYLDGASPYSVLDMAGNVWEWTSSLDKLYPYDPADGRENLEASGSRVVRGSSWYGVRIGVRCAFREGYDPAGRSSKFGFRVCVVAP